jgi:hypothetical protein
LEGLEGGYDLVLGEGRHQGESWRGLRGSEEVIERRREAEDMIVETDREMMQNKRTSLSTDISIRSLD